MSDYTTWHVGMKVVCVNSDPGQRLFAGEKMPIEGRVYTLREIYDEDGTVGVRLNEIINPTGYRVRGGSTTECGFCASRFRKVQPRKTSIASLEAILHGACVPEDA